MTTIAAPRHERIVRDGVPGWLKFLLSGGILTTLVSAAIALGVPALTRGWQNREKGIELKTLIATDMSTSFTQAIGTGQSIGTGLFYGPTGDSKQNAAVVQGAFNRGLGQWKIDSGRINAELLARFPHERHGGIVTRWQSYRQAVTQFYRLGAVLPSYVRHELADKVQSYVYRFDPKGAKALSDTQWWNLGRVDAKLGPLGFRNRDRFRRRLEYRNAYTSLGERLLALGESYVQGVLELKPEL